MRKIEIITKHQQQEKQFQEEVNIFFQDIERKGLKVYGTKYHLPEPYFPNFQVVIEYGDPED